MIQQFRYQEIDLLRGIAILMMITNHFGVTFLNTIERSSGIFSLLTFLGGFAPVIFYFVTGLGYGINYSKRIYSGYWYDVLFKMLILILVERVAHLFDGKLYGMDFLSFIALIILVLSIVRYFQLGNKVLCGIIFVMLAMRFFFGPIMLPDKETSHIISWLFGVSSLKNFSYPITPWLIYPLLGYCLGNFIKQNDFSFAKLVSSYNNIFILGGGLMVISLFVVTWVKDGYTMFRWGTMSLDYFILSVLLLILIVVLAPRLAGKSFSGFISIGGITSLLVVPVHYFLLKFEVLNFYGGGFINILNLILILVLSYVISNLISKIISQIRYLPHAYIFMSLIPILILVFLAFTHDQNGIVQINSLIFILQISLAAFFVVKPSFMNKQH